MDKLITVIIPVYNVEKYLKRCLDSIINQTYKNLEIILVDDGSIDKSAEICDNYAEIDDRITVIHKTNGGLADARNVGIDIATGEYLSFIDSDDFIHKDMYMILFNNLIAYDADISICNFKRIRTELNYNETTNNFEIFCFTNVEALNYWHCEEKALNTDNNSFAVQLTIVCNKLYKKNLFKDMRFPKGKYFEDEFISYKIIYKSRRIVYTNMQMYYYVYRKDSIINEKFSLSKLNKAKDIIAAVKEQTFFYKELGFVNLYLLSGYMYLTRISKYYLILLNEYKENKIDLKCFKDEYDCFYKEFKFKNKLSILRRLRIKIFYINPKFYRLAVKIYEKITRLKIY